MESWSLCRVLFLFLLALHFTWLSQVIAQSTPCTTPTKQQGLCVPIQQCRNIFKITQVSVSPPIAVTNYIKEAKCTLPGVTRSICCQLSEVEKKNLLPEKCGISVGDRISNGNLTGVFDYPWMALLRYSEDGEIKDGCGGSLISKRYVLTAAHCLKTRSTLKLDHIRLGEHTRNQEIDCNIHTGKDGEEIERDCADAVEDYGVESIIVHPDFNKPKYSNDIGLVRLSRDVTMKAHIEPICLPVTPELRSMQLDKYIVTGWGTTENQTGSDVLLYALIPRVDLDTCRQKMAQHGLTVQLSDQQLCAGGVGNVDTCRGDPGGPLGFGARTAGKLARFVQFGIVSAVKDSCGLKNIPGICCRVGSYMEWILANLNP